MINWTEWWEDHPKKYAHDKTIWWANLRPETYSYQDTFKYLEGVLHFKDTDFVLDAGCGTGELSELVGPKVALYKGIDFSSSAIKIAQQRHAKYPFTRNPLHNIDSLDEEYHKVFLLGVWQYVPYEFADNSIRDLLRVTKTGGKILIGDVLSKSDPAAQVFDYGKDYWKKFNAKVEFLQSSYEPDARYDVLLTK